ncbi:MAG: PQQ-binding-like beta-propeller repeat protein [Phycisphaerae bacterium]|nr:PQQ-binding-like beta-propeller repeat protein [Phycisphaerae bacterium]
MIATFRAHSSARANTAISSALALCLVYAAPLGLARAGDWTTGVGGNSTRNGLSPEVGPTEPDLLWGGSLPAIVAQQGACEGNLLVLSRIGSWAIPTGTWIVAHDLTTGQQLWTTRLPFDFPETSWRSRVSAIRDGQVYASRAGNTNLDYLYALSPADGSVLWRSEDLIDEGAVESLAFTGDGDIIAGNHYGLLRISWIDGSTMWQSPRTCPTTNGCQAAVWGDHIYVWETSGSSNGPVISVFAVDGGAKLYASPPIGGGYVQQAGPFVGPDGTVYAPRTQGDAATDFLVAYEDTGTALSEKWSAPLGFVPFSSFGVGPDGSIYTYTTVRDGDTAFVTVLRLDPDTGNVLHASLPILTDYPPSGQRIAIDARGKVFLTNGGYTYGAFYSFDADLTLRWSEGLPGVNVGGPVLGQGGIVVVCGTGTNVLAYHTTTPGDMNCDGVLNGLDVQPFVLALLDPTQYELDFPCGVGKEDINADGVLDVLDLRLFVQGLLVGRCR